jgi:hypothetical protein
LKKADQHHKQLLFLKWTLATEWWNKQEHAFALRLNQAVNMVNFCKGPCLNCQCFNSWKLW